MKTLNLKTGDMLQRKQLKTVFGGYGGDACSGNLWCSDDYDCPGTCKCKTDPLGGENYCE